MRPVAVGNGRPTRLPASGQPQTGRAQAARHVVVDVEFPAERRFHAAARLVAGGAASRLGLAVDEIGDLRLAIDAVLLERPAGRTLRLTISEAGEEAFDLELGPFEADADRAGLSRVLRALADDVQLHREGHGDWIAVRVTRQPSRDSR